MIIVFKEKGCRVENGFKKDFSLFMILVFQNEFPGGKSFNY